MGDKEMIIDVLLWGTVAGIVHFVLIGLLYGNPVVDKQYSNASQESPAVKKWTSKPKYLLTQFLGTQIEVFILTFAFFWFRSLLPNSGMAWVFIFSLLISAVRVFPRFWNMWIQTTYPRRLLAIEAINGTIGTLAIITLLEVVHR